MKKRLLIFTLSLLMIITSACSTEQADVVATDTLIYGSSSDYTRLNPIFEEHGEINKLIFSGLTKYDKERNVQMDLAESVLWNDSENAYEISIRNDAKWHDGQVVSSEDVAFTLNQIAKPENASEIASNYIDIKEIQIVDNKNLKIFMEEANSAFLGYLSIGIIPKHLLENENVSESSYNKAPIGTGPYKVKDFKQGQYVELERFDEYYGNKSTIKNLIFKIIVDEKTRAMELKAGSIDLAQIGPMEIEMFQDKEKYNIFNNKTSDYRGILFNFRNPLFESVKLRQAISYSIDKEAIVNSVLNGYAEAAYSQLQRSEYNNENIEKYSYNPEKAKILLEEEGYTLVDGIYEKNGEKLSFEIISPEGDLVREQLSMAAAENMRAVGIDVSVNIAAYGSFSWDDMDAYLIGWGSPYDPDDHMYKVFHSEETATGSNLGAYSNPKVDEYLLKARRNFDKEKRKTDYALALEELANDPAFAMIAYVDAIYVASSKITGIESKILGHHGVGFLDDISNWKVD